jgi:uncharacterized membrane protein YkvA (DUF1232 family)
MNRQEAPKDSQITPPDTGLVVELLRQLKLIWRLIKDRRVPVWLKAIPFLSLVYLLIPADFVPDILIGLGQLDDMAVLALGAKLFTELVPEEVVREHREELAAQEGGWTVVDGEAERLDDPEF